MARKLTKDEQRCYQHYIRRLRKRFPLSKPVMVRTVSLSDCYGATCRTPDGYLIEIDSSTSYDARIETLGHEWSHAIDFDRNGHKVALRDMHNPKRWGPIYAEVHEFMEEIAAELNTEEHDG